ncbi:Uncharacterised protein [Chlamydia trachomatis]|nr:Uncharacterised protein [Chlamydia trachomatis]
MESPCPTSMICTSPKGENLCKLYCKSKRTIIIPHQILLFSKDTSQVRHNPIREITSSNIMRKGGFPNGMEARGNSDAASAALLQSTKVKFNNDRRG